MSGDNLELLVPVEEEGKTFLQSSVILSPSEITRTNRRGKFPSIRSFIAPKYVLEKCREDDVDLNSLSPDDFYWLYQDSLHREDLFDKIVPDFFRGDSLNLGLEGKLPSRTLHFSSRREISQEEVLRLYYKTLLRYSELAKKWSRKMSEEVVGFSLDPQIASLSTDTKLPDFKFTVPKVFNYFGLDSQMKVRCGVTYYVRKNI